MFLQPFIWYYWLNYPTTFIEHKSLLRRLNLSIFEFAITNDSWTLYMQLCKLWTPINDHRGQEVSLLLYFSLILNRWVLEFEFASIYPVWQGQIHQQPIIPEKFLQGLTSLVMLLMESLKRNHLILDCHRKTAPASLPKLIWKWIPVICQYNGRKHSLLEALFYCT